MKLVTTFLSSPSAACIVMALLHTLWQATNVAAALFLFLRVCPVGRAGLRYVACLAGLASVVLCAVITWWVLDYSSLHRPAPAIVEHAFVDHVPGIPMPASFVAIPAGGSHNATFSSSRTVKQLYAHLDWHGWAMSIWLAGVCAMLARVAWSVSGATRLRQGCTPVTDPALLAMLSRLQQQMGLKRIIPLLSSEDIRSPAVLGLIWPTLLLPVSAVNGIPPLDLQAILAHELAHLRAYDHVIGLAQVFVESLLFFNPAVWWISRQVRIEREARCDAAAVAVTGDSQRYAELLLRWTERFPGTDPVPAAFAMFGRRDEKAGNRLLERIRRILTPGYRPRLRVAWYVIAAALVGIGAIVFSVAPRGRVGAVAMARLFRPRGPSEGIPGLSGTHGARSRQYRTAGRTSRSAYSGTAGALAPDRDEEPSQVQIAGQVVGPDGVPAADALVTVTTPRLASEYSRPDWSNTISIDGSTRGGTKERATERTDEEGRFSVGGLPDASPYFQLIASHPRLAPAEVRIINEPPKVQYEARLALGPAFTIKGRTLDAQANPVPRVRVRRLQAQGAWVEPRRARTGRGVGNVERGMLNAEC